MRLFITIAAAALVALLPLAATCAAEPPLRLNRFEKSAAVPISKLKLVRSRYLLPADKYGKVVAETKVTVETKAVASTSAVSDHVSSKVTVDTKAVAESKAVKYLPPLSKVFLPYQIRTR